METLVKQDDNLTNVHSFFVSKEHYLSFRAAWKQYIADGKHKRATYIDAWGGRCKEPSSLTAAHHLVYNALRKRDLHKSFAPLTNPNKVGNDPYRAFDHARGAISWAAKYRPDRLLAPFGGTVTEAMLKELSETLKSVAL